MLITRGLGKYEKYVSVAISNPKIISHELGRKLMKSHELKPDVKSKELKPIMICKETV